MLTRDRKLFETMFLHHLRYGVPPRETKSKGAEDSPTRALRFRDEKDTIHYCDKLRMQVFTAPVPEKLRDPLTS